MSMHQIDLTRVDLNLLVVFEALMRERHVGRAATRLSLSQSATSHALRRLRTLLDDPLFVRNPRGIEPTPRGRDLAQPVSDALSQLRQLLSPQPAFDPATLRRTFTIAAHDYAIAALMPSLMADLRVQAPGVDLRCVSIHPSDVIAGLDRGELDFALGGFIDIKAERVTRTVLFSDRFVGVARRGHPQLKAGRMSLEDFVNLPHVLMSPNGQSRGDVDQALSSLGVERRVAITVPNFLAIPYVIENADIIGVLPERLALRTAATSSLALFDLPMEVDCVTCSMLVLTPLIEQAEIKWLTTLLKSAAKAIA
ncbi:LysR family transcriptional regulator [Solihabitans fulvus]|uniref:LysR family transcriptional regulator n=1 Tax=Solihabitans fulvus TaxID=1892852 RepID=A0A5B2XSV3_9PSEU|nr:LysR family transcriptional regulator [Solihabitans fulvus]KAA2266032.1 LysR family transcriptional regulator [Solihabitans fulvus]